MKIITPGAPMPPPIIPAYRGTCLRCGAVVECAYSEMEVGTRRIPATNWFDRLLRIPGYESAMCCQCPTEHCGKLIPVKREPLTTPITNLNTISKPS